MIRFENLGYKYTADEIIEYYSAPPVNEYFVSFCENLIEQLRQIGKMRTTETYTTTLNSFKRFMHSRKRDRDIPFDNVDSLQYLHYHPLSNRVEITLGITNPPSGRIVKRLLADAVTKGMIEVL
ncbi:phage integrase SAM-like domain-containing protein [Bacteroides thetaiotaomicron]|uniref:phage integrase SAM-like domain-containing protein n=1 Tax=Bacteroides thetaiotaomicron TaxID=818 RepID=UPI003DA416A1